MSAEIKPIKGFDGYYISEYGDIYSYRFNKVKKVVTYLNKQGYLWTNFCMKYKKSKKSVARLVAENFLTTWNENLQVNHLDANKLNNHYSNLEMVTGLENMRHAYKLGLINKKGENHGRNKLNNKAVFEIREMLLEGILSRKQIANLYKVTTPTIDAIKTGKTWSHI